jgi:hypothetical protein
LLATHLKRPAVFLLLFVDNAQPEVYLMGFVEVWLHLHDLGEGIFGEL